MATNLWRKFEELVGGPAEEVMKISQAPDSTGMVKAERMTGENTTTGIPVKLRCTISVNVGQKVFVAGGEVKATAPDLNYYEIEV